MFPKCVYIDGDETLNKLSKKVSQIHYEPMKRMAKTTDDRKSLQREMEQFQVIYRSVINGAVNIRRSNVNTKMKKAYTGKSLAFMLSHND